MILTFLNEGFWPRELKVPSGSNLTCDIETNKQKACTFVFFFPFLFPRFSGCDSRQNIPKHEDFVTYHRDVWGVSLVSWWLLELGSISP